MWIAVFGDVAEFIERHWGRNGKGVALSETEIEN